MSVRGFDGGYLPCNGLLLEQDYSAIGFYNAPKVSVTGNSI